VESKLPITRLSLMRARRASQPREEQIMPATGTNAAPANSVAVQTEPPRKEHTMLAKETKVAPTKPQPPTRLAPFGINPLRTLERFADEATRLFDDFGLGLNWSRVQDSDSGSGEIMTWAPRVDISQHKDELIIRADLPGIEKADLKVNVTENALTIHGERHRVQEEERDGVYRSERSFGAFSRTIALPPGTATDKAKASFKNGVLEIRIPAAPGVEGRPVEITE
jgi:HSP20 family protein